VRSERLTHASVIFVETGGRRSNVRDRDENAPERSQNGPDLERGVLVEVTAPGLVTMSFTGSTVRDADGASSDAVRTAMRLRGR
jgi:hypothetical protein